MFYDAAGNQINDGSGPRIYDAENRMVTATKGGVSSSYTYDADGQRVRRIIGGVETWQVYGIGGELLAEYAAGASPTAPQKEYGYRGGQMLVVWDGSETGDRQLQWLVQDHLGSTRMVVDRSGSLGGVRRHDFGPFGEELSAGVGIRSASNGYGDDLVRQKYTGKERDPETNLDYFGARYFADVQGRFTSVDPLMSSAHTIEPQSWNRYAYTLNNPLRFVDVKGLYVWGAAAGGNATDEELRRRREDRSLSRNERNAARDALNFRERFRTALNNAMNAASALPAGAERDQASRAVHSYGNENSVNGVTVTVGNLPNGVAGQVSADPNQPLSYDEATNTFTANVIVTFAPGTTGDSLTISTGHEGSHVADRRDFAGAARAGNDALNGPFNLSKYQTEFRAYTVSSAMAQGLGLPNLSQGRNEIWNSGWSAADRATLRANGINEHLRTSPTYQVTPQNQGPPLYPRQ
jgi:RHS repeat-associated protein